MIIEYLKKKHGQIVAFADLRATGFFTKMGFKSIDEDDTNVRKHLLPIIERCTRAKLMIY